MSGRSKRNHPHTPAPRSAAKPARSTANQGKSAAGNKPPPATEAIRAEPPAGYASKSQPAALPPEVPTEGNAATPRSAAATQVAAPDPQPALHEAADRVGILTLLVAVLTADAAVFILEHAWVPLVGGAVIGLAVTGWVWWTQRRRRIVAFVAAVAMAVNLALAVHAGFAVAEAFRGEPDPAAVDVATLNSLRAGDEYASFEAALGPDTATIRSGMSVTWQGRTYQLQDRFFLLKTAYVEAFVDQNNTVDAYTVTARHTKPADLPQGLKFLGVNYDLGKSTMSLDTVTGLAGACAVHIEAAYLISGTDEANDDQTVAIGETASGPGSLADTTGTPEALCPDGTSYPYTDFGHGTVPWTAEGAKVVDGSGKYVIDTGQLPSPFGVGADYYKQEKAAYGAVPVNAVSITAPNFPMLAQFISLHPQTVAEFDPKWPYG